MNTDRQERIEKIEREQERLFLLYEADSHLHDDLIKVLGELTCRKIRIAKGLE